MNMNENYSSFFINEEISLGEDSLVLLQKIFRPKTIKKDMYFLQQGERSVEMGLITKGLFRSYYLDRKGNDITKYFYQEGSMLFSYVAHLTQKESAYSIQALEDSEILVARISDFEETVEGNYQLLSFYKRMIDYTLVMKEEHALSFKLLSSIERYKQFLTQYPGLEERIKQYQLASYLGITPVSLSRIRNRLGLNK